MIYIQSQKAQGTKIFQTQKQIAKVSDIHLLFCIPDLKLRDKN